MQIDPDIPLPTEESATKTQEFYQTRYKKEISREDAYEILSWIIRFLYLTILINLEGEEGTEEIRALFKGGTKEGDIRHVEALIAE